MIRYFFALLLMGVTFYIASIYGSTTIALLGYVEALLMVLSFGYVLYEKKSLRVTLELPPAMADQDQPILIRAWGRFRRRGCYGRIQVRVAVRRNGGWIRQHKWLRAESCREGSGAKGSRELSGLLKIAQSGCYEIGLKCLRIYDMTGLFYLDCRKMVRGERAKLVVLPHIYPVGIRLSEAVHNFTGEAEVYDELRSGEDASESLKLRPFQAGDKLRNIHWKLSAKSEELIVRENSRPKGCPVVILVESAGDIFGAQLPCVASLSFTLMDLECPHYVAWQSRQWQDIMRIRVDDEESFYECLLYLMQDGIGGGFMDMQTRYQEKYSSEIVLHYIRVESGPGIRVDNREILQLKAAELERSLGELEVQL